MKRFDLVSPAFIAAAIETGTRLARHFDSPAIRAVAEADMRLHQATIDDARRTAFGAAGDLPPLPRFVA